MEELQLEEAIDILKDPIAFFTLVTGLVPHEYQKKIMLDKSKRITVRVCRQGGKTLVIAVKVLYETLTNNNFTSMIISPTKDQSFILYRKIEGFLENTTFLNSFVKLHIRTRMWFDNNSWIMTTAISAIRGYSPNLLVLDEAAFINDDFYSAAEPALAATNGNLILISTPFGKIGRFYDSFFKEGMCEMFSKYHVPGTDIPHISKEFLEEKRKGCLTNEYLQEYCAEFIEEADNFFSRELIKASIDDVQQMNEPDRSAKSVYFLGVDVARYGEDETVFVISRKLINVEAPVDIVFIGSTEKKPLTDTIGRIINLHEIWNFGRIFIDETALGCLCKGTEILTNNGWMKIEDITPDNKVYSRDKKGVMILSECIVKNKISDTIMLDGIKFSSTHTFLGKTRKEYPFKEYPFYDLLNKKRVYLDNAFIYEEKKKDFILDEYSITMPYGGKKIIRRKLKIDSLVFSKFLGWFLSEGCLCNINGFRITISQSIKSNKLADIENVLMLLGLHYNKSTAKSGEVSYNLFDKILYSYLKEECYDGGRDARYKKIPDFVKFNSKEVINSFINEYVKGDGYIHNGVREIVTASKKLANDIQELFIKLGILSGILIKQKKDSVSIINGRELRRTTNIFCVYEQKEKSKTLTIRDIIKKDDEEVFDINVNSDSKHILVRFDNKIFWTHNGGVVDTLLERKMPIEPITFNEKCKYSINLKDSNKEAMYKNLKFVMEKNLEIRQYNELNENKKGLIFRMPRNEKLINQLVNLRYSYGSSGSLMLSPLDDKGHDDYSDSLALSLFWMITKADKKSSYTIF